MENTLGKMQSDMLDAMKAKNEERTSVLKLVIAAIKTEEINKGKPLTSEEIYKIIRANIKAMNEAALQYKQVGSQENAERELNQIKILEVYLPKELSLKEVESLVSQAIKKVGASAPQDMGKVMGELMPQIAGRAEGVTVQQVVQKQLAKS